MKISSRVERWPLRHPFQITGYTFESVNVVVAEVEHDGIVGIGEAAGVYYRGETADLMMKQIQALAVGSKVLSRHVIAELLPAGGARNAIDCALWDLEAKAAGVPVWKLAGVSKPQPLLTTITLGADKPGAMAEAATGYREALALKLKLLGDGDDAERVRAVRSARPDVWMAVDANQGFTADSLEAILPVLTAAGVRLIEQPFPLDRDQEMDGLNLPIPVAADESAQDLESLERLRGRFDVINIKLDKSGGLTEALAMLLRVAKMGLRPMVGNMLGTSMAMAPAFLVGQSCAVVDLDGPIFLSSDRNRRVDYVQGKIQCAEDVWGAPNSLISAGQVSR